MKMQQRQKFVRYPVKSQNTAVDITTHTLPTNSSDMLLSGEKDTLQAVNQSLLGGQMKDDCSNKSYVCQISTYFPACAGEEKNKKKAITSSADKPFWSLTVGKFQA